MKTRLWVFVRCWPSRRIRQRRVLVKATFDITAQNALADYKGTGGATGDYLTSSTYSRIPGRRRPDGRLADQSVPGPDIAPPPTAGPQGGNAMYGNSNNALTTRQGYWIEMQPALANQNFTIEAFFLIENLAPAFAEYQIENVVSTFWMSDGKGLELRLMGDFGEGQLQ
jgi:hypothetical protein